MMLRLDLSTCGNRGTSRSSAVFRELCSRYKKLALKVHPDKVPREVQEIIGMHELFTEAFKALQQAHELLVRCYK
jgi:curved DNA-binding protein CbpA